MTTTATAPKEALILAGEGYSLQIAPDALTLRDSLIEAAASITTVSTNEQAEAARSEVQQLAKLRNLVEKSRKTIKEPVLEIGRQIDAKAKEFLAELEGHEKRLSGAIGSYAAKLEAERRAALLKAQEEERQRIAAEQKAAQEAAAAEAAALAAKKAAEDAMFADEEGDAEKAKEEAAKAEAASIEAKRIQAEQAAAAERAKAESFAAPAVVAPQGVKFEPEFEVVDAAALYAAFPDLCEITVKRAPTLARIKAWMDSHGGELPTVPGLAITKKAKVSTR